MRRSAYLVILRYVLARRNVERDLVERLRQVGF